MKHTELNIILISACVLSVFIAINTYSGRIEARDYCPVQPYMRGTQDCARVPTMEIPPCPYPVANANTANMIVDSSITYLTDTEKRILIW